MSNLFELLKKDRMSFKINKSQLESDLLTTLVGEIQTKSLQPKTVLNDDLVTSIIKSFIKNIDQSLSMITNNNDINKLTKEKELLTSYLPVVNLISEDKLKELILNIKQQHSPTNIGVYMKLLTSTGNSFDKQLASNIIKSLI